MAEASDILPQIQFLITDKLQVVSYKWLSRNFSISSNDAKRLLQSFVEEHGSGLEVVYTLAGWSTENPQAYHIRLVPGSKLAEAKQEFKDNYSVQVYCVQACVPKDPAVLWSTEYEQTEELFDQPESVVNCLRDNRFCGISNSFVKRNLEGKPIISASLSKNDLGNSLACKNQKISGGSLQTQKTNFAAQSSTPVNPGEEKPVTVSNTNSHIKATHDKEKPTAVPSNRIKGKSEKDSATNGGSLANLWGRASAKPKTSVQSVESGNASARPSMEAQPMSVCKTPESINSDDEEQTFSIKRESTGGSGRKRKVVFAFSDDEDEEDNVVSLSSPEPPARAPVSGKGQNNGQSYMEKSTPNEENNSTEPVITPETSVQLNLEASTKGIDESTKSKTAKSPLPDEAKTTIPEGSSDERTNVTAKPSTTSNKMKKVLKTRIDERGREVTEVVWEEHSTDKDREHVNDHNTSDENKATDGAGSRPPGPKAAASIPTVPSHVVNKAGNKKAQKGPQKDVKQGNILSFFKKV